MVIRFWFGWSWLSSSVCLFWPAVVAGGTVGDGGWVLVVVVGLGDASSAGCEAVLGGVRCGRVRSASRSSGARQRTASAAIYDLWRRSFSGGMRYGDDGGA